MLSISSLTTGSLFELGRGLKLVDLMSAGLRFKSKTNNGIFCVLKVAVKKARGFGNKNMFHPKKGDGGGDRQRGMD